MHTDRDIVRVYTRGRATARRPVGSPREPLPRDGRNEHRNGLRAVQVHEQETQVSGSTAALMEQFGLVLRSNVSCTRTGCHCRVGPLMSVLFQVHARDV